MEAKYLTEESIPTQAQVVIIGGSVIGCSVAYHHLPILDDAARFSYYREETGGLLIGLFEPAAAPWGWPAYWRVSSLAS